MGKHKRIIFFSFSYHVFLITKWASDFGHENQQSQFVFLGEDFFSLVFEVLIKAFDHKIRHEHKITDVFRRQKQKRFLPLPGSDKVVVFLNT